MPCEQPFAVVPHASKADRSERRLERVPAGWIGRSKGQTYGANPDFAARYTEGPKRFVPGHQGMLRMT